MRVRSIHLISRGRLLIAIGLVVLLGFVTLLGNLLSSEPDEPLEDEDPPMEEHEDAEVEAALAEEVEPEREEETGLASLRLQRNQSRSEQIDILRDLASRPDAGEDSRVQAEKRLIQISDRLAAESEAEQLIISAGFADALVYVMQDNALALVKEDTLEDREVSQIASMVARVTGLSWEDISVRTQP